MYTIKKEKNALLLFFKDNYIFYEVSYDALYKRLQERVHNFLSDDYLDYSDETNYILQNHKSLIQKLKRKYQFWKWLSDHISTFFEHVFF